MTGRQEKQGNRHQGAKGSEGSKFLRQIHQELLLTKRVVLLCNITVSS